MVDSVEQIPGYYRVGLPPTSEAWVSRACMLNTNTIYYELVFVVLYGVSQTNAFDRCSKKQTIAIDLFMIDADFRVKL